MKWVTVAWLGACAAVLTGCGSDDERVVLTDAGRLCLLAEEPVGSPALNAPQDYQADERLYAVVEVGGGSCEENRVFTCSTSLAGSTLTVTSEYAYDRSDEMCDAMATMRTTTCTTDPLPAADYTVVYGPEDYPLTIPSTRPEACFP